MSVESERKNTRRRREKKEEPMATRWMQIAILTIVLTISGPVPVPESGFAAIKTVKPGEWVTVTSRHQPSTEDDAVVSVRPYGASTTTE
jgi:hypothetical protein